MISFLYNCWLRMLVDWRHSLLILTLAVLWLMLVADFIKGYAFNMTESVDGKIFKLRPELTVQKNTTVIFERKDPILPVGVDHMTKHVLCMPGDILRRDGFDFFCNGHLITRAKPYSNAGDLLPIFGWIEGPVPTGVFFAGTDHPDGYDSRYFGFIPLDSATVVERTL